MSPNDIEDQGTIPTEKVSETKDEPPERKLPATLRLEARDFLQQGWDALKIVLLLTLLCGVAFPTVVFVLGQIAFSKQANGSLITNDQGAIIGSELIGQQFTRSEYFHGRPSVVGYNAAGSSGSNLGPTNPQLINGNGSTYAGVKNYADLFRAENNLPTGTELPPDIVTASGSGLDPHISVQAARLQVDRVMAARKATPDGTNISREKVYDLITSNIEKRSLGVLGEPGVNVLKLNLALDAIFGVPVEGEVTR